MAATIYALKCIPNNMAYVGCTKGKLAKRFREHRCLLNAGVHKCQELQNDWKTFGAACFEMLSLENLLTDGLLEKRAAELYWMQRYAEQSKLYNEHQISFQPEEEARKRGVANAHNKPGNRWTPEANARRSASQLGIPKGHGAKISATKRAKREQEMR